MPARLTAITCTVAVCLAAASTSPLAPPLRAAALRIAAAGPAWISIETPVNPYDASTRGAYLVVHAYHHGDPSSNPVSGTAEGLVNGERRSVALEFTPTSRPSAY